jgi:hypothetical protein
MTTTAAGREATNTAREKLYTLTVRVAACERQTTAEAKRFAETDALTAGRKIRLSECPVLSTNLKGEGQLTRGDEVEILIYEFESDQQVIGSFDSLAFLELSLPPAAFAEFWSGCAAADGVARNVNIYFKSDGTDYFRITRVDLVEYMAGAVDYNPKGHAPGYLPGRPHPVVAELRDMRQRFVGNWQGFLILICIVAGFTFLTDMLRAAWRFIQH